MTGEIEQEIVHKLQQAWGLPVDSMRSMSDDFDLLMAHAERTMLVIQHLNTVLDWIDHPNVQFTRLVLQMLMTADTKGAVEWCLLAQEHIKEHDDLARFDPTEIVQDRAAEEEAAGYQALLENPMWREYQLLLLEELIVNNGEQPETLALKRILITKLFERLTTYAPEGRIMVDGKTYLRRVVVIEGFTFAVNSNRLTQVEQIAPGSDYYRLIF